MTYKQLCDEVTALGFESGIDNATAMLTATRRALRIIFTEHPSYATLEIYKEAVTPSVRLEQFRHRGSEIDKLPFDSVAYSFKTSGTGRYRITDGSGEKTYDFSKSQNIHRGFLHGKGELEFLGDYSYSVYDLALFDELYGDSVEDIPIISGYKEYDIKSFSNDFISFVKPPMDSDGNVISGSSVRGTKISIPESYFGKIILVYKRAPEEVGINPDEEILLPEGCEHLLPLLVAAYVWLDDDADKSQYYMSLYREAMASVKYYDRTQINTGYRETNGWA